MAIAGTAFNGIFMIFFIYWVAFTKGSELAAEGDCYYSNSAGSIVLSTAADAINVTQEFMVVCKLGLALFVIGTFLSLLILK